VLSVTNSKLSLAVSGDRGYRGRPRGQRGGEIRERCPRGLRGREIGMWHANQSKKRRAEAERNSVCCLQAYLYLSFVK